MGGQLGPAKTHTATNLLQLPFVQKVRMAMYCGYHMHMFAHRCRAVISAVATLTHSRSASPICPNERNPSYAGCSAEALVINLLCSASAKPRTSAAWGCSTARLQPGRRSARQTSIWRPILRRRSAAPSLRSARKAAASGSGGISFPVLPSPQLRQRWCFLAHDRLKRTQSAQASPVALRLTTFGLAAD